MNNTVRPHWASHEFRIEGFPFSPLWRSSHQGVCPVCGAPGNVHPENLESQSVLTVTKESSSVSMPTPLKTSRAENVHAGSFLQSHVPTQLWQMVIRGSIMIRRSKELAVSQSEQPTPWYLPYEGPSEYDPYMFRNRDAYNPLQNALNSGPLQARGSH